MLYQLKLLSDMSDYGEPGPLPKALQGSLSSRDLEDLSWTPEQFGLRGFGYFEVQPPPSPSPRWIHKALFKRRFTQEERIAIRLAEANEAVPEQARWALTDFREVLDATDQVNLDDVDLIAGLDLLVTLGLIGSLRPAQIRE